MVLAHNGPGDLDFLTWLPGSHSGTSEGSLRRAYETIIDYLECHESVMILERIYGSLDAAGEALAEREGVLRERGLPHAPPATYVEGSPCVGSGVAGVHVVAARPTHSASAHLISHDGVPCGWTVRGKDASYLTLSDIGRLRAPLTRQNPWDEARVTFDLASRLMDAEGWSYGDVQRTWFYLDHILDWYPEFNEVRNAAYARLGLLGRDARAIIPASTGIAGASRHGLWCTLDLLATRPSNGGHYAVRRLTNPSQNEAPEYGAAFSRGLAIDLSEISYLLVSGTASIDDHGQSMHRGDFAAQVNDTLDAVSALLASAGAGLTDIIQATAFIKDRSYAETLARVLDQRGLANLAPICAVADVCRDELLFELDATAIQVKRPHGVC
jgi:enamine deaminase RidA (YjgF/YER057c/UK114 family)